MSTVVSAVAHPKVVEVSIDRALEADGIQDCKILFKRSALLPVLVGSRINAENLMLSQAGILDIRGVQLLSEDII